MKMTLNYSKMYDAMNELEMVSSKVSSAREILDSALDALEIGNCEKTQKLINAAYEFLGYYLEESDVKFKNAWNETVVKLKQEEDDAWDTVLKEKDYYEPSMPPWGHSDLEYISKHYTDEEMSAMCDNAAEQDKLKRWILPVEIDGITGDLFVTFPDDLLEQTGWKEGDSINFEVDVDGSIVVSSKTTPFDDGFRITE